MMKKLALLFLVGFFSSSSYAISADDAIPDDFTWSTIEHENMTMEQTKEKNSRQAANIKEGTKNKETTVQKVKIKKNLKLTQNKATNSTQCVNAYYSDGKKNGGVYQGIEAKTATYIQKGGSGNTQGGNCIFKN
jgi:hypothetical protein